MPKEKEKEKLRIEYVVKIKRIILLKSDFEGYKRDYFYHTKRLRFIGKHH